MFRFTRAAFAAAMLLAAGCASAPTGDGSGARYIYTADFMADPSVHLYEGRIYIYPTHDRVSEVTIPDDGAHYDMADYHVLKMDSVSQAQAVDCGCVLTLDDVPWAEKQMWANDVAFRDGRYYMYFPAKDREGIFRIGVAVADSPEGPFTPQAEPVEGLYSIDPAVFDDGGVRYIYFGGLAGGQLQRWHDNELLDENRFPSADEAALAPRVARLADDMLSLAAPSQAVEILDAEGRPLRSDDPRRFFEAAWMHRRGDTYFFTYSTGTEHTLCWAAGDNPLGPFTFGGVLMTPVTGWTTHHSTVEIDGRWYLFHHDSKPSGGRSTLRSLKVVELLHDADGKPLTVDGGREE